MRRQPRRRWTFPWALDDGPDRSPASGRYNGKLPPQMSRRALSKILEDIQDGGTLATAALTANRSERWLKYQVHAFPAIKAAIENSRKVRLGELQKLYYVNARLPGKQGVADRIWLGKNELGWSDRQTIAATVDVNLIPMLVARSRAPELEAAVRAEIEEGARAYAAALEAREAGRPVARLEARTIDVEPDEAST